MEASRPKVEISLTKFAGTCDPDLYIEWENHTELVFDYCGYLEWEKVELAAIHFTGYALSWWIQEKNNRADDGKSPINTWNLMKIFLQQRFVPADYRDKARVQLECCKQGNRSPEDYYRELEQLCWKQGIRVSTEEMKAKYLAGLNLEVREIVEAQAQPFHKIYSLVQLSNIVYKGLQRKDSLEENDDEDSHLEILFDNKCTIKDQQFSVYISGSSCCNVINDEVVARLGLPTMKLPQPYYLMSINDDHKMRVEKQVHIEFSIGPYKDSLLCDVAPIHNTDLLIGRPWQFDREIKIYFGTTTHSYVFDLNGRFITLIMLPPKHNFLWLLRRDPAPITEKVQETTVKPKKKQGLKKKK